jgi:hypothetical protein
VDSAKSSPAQFDANLSANRPVSDTSFVQIDASNASVGAKIPFAAGKWPVHIAPRIDSF